MILMMSLKSGFYFVYSKTDDIVKTKVDNEDLVYIFQSDYPPIFILDSIGYYDGNN